ncbi:PiggyBac transposable element-derived protein 4 [Araneus ventricosus]|uniref:PiggyBac transposable element-derived protein 4 n=1 Tax=Araneus ventricosus TaxID=182803 RepID=A0A4Y2Q528_ARAVE|nr:PiggyBac transposable element-derived protein 4 [Araneus ventricosus]
MSKRKRELTKEEIEAILLASDDSVSDLSSEDDGWPVDESLADVSFILNNDPGDETDEDQANDEEAANSASTFKPSWTEQMENGQIDLKQHQKYGGGPKHNLPVGSEAGDYFKMLFTNDMCEKIRENTNKYAEFVKSATIDKWEPIGIKKWRWKPIEDIEELFNFIAIILIMGIAKLPRIKDYWSSNPMLGNDKVKRTMARDRFVDIYRFFHISDRENEVSPNDPSFYMMRKLDPFMSCLRSNFQMHFEPYPHLSVDEAMVKYKGRLGIVQYMPNKPVKRGIKVWALCTSFFGYVYNFEPYCGKKDKLPRNDNGLGYSVVTFLTKNLSKGHHIYIDRFYTSVVLMKDLLKSGIYASGTVNTNRKYLPTNIKNVKLADNGSSKCFQCIEEPNLTCTVWKDKKEIFLLSNGAKNEITTVKRRIGGNVSYVTCPKVIADYNKYMGGVDLADQYRKYYDISRKSRKWWIYMFWYLLDTTVNNAYIIYSTTNFPSEKKSKTPLDFRMSLIEAILKEKRIVETCPQTIVKNKSHKRIKIDGRKKRCIRCISLKRKTISNRAIESSWTCEICQVCLCVNCFGPYHNEHH